MIETLGWVCPFYKGKSCNLHVRKKIVPTLAFSPAV